MRIYTDQCGRTYVDRGMGWAQDQLGLSATVRSNLRTNLVTGAQTVSPTGPSRVSSAYGDFDACMREGVDMCSDRNLWDWRDCYKRTRQHCADENCFRTIYPSSDPEYECVKTASGYTCCK